uniref:Peptidase M20 dimerisation domain-containing protein n=2 Tax=Parascaris univalens TaxID=6257 RepID=A0A914ZHT1_PARUN
CLSLLHQPTIFGYRRCLIVMSIDRQYDTIARYIDANKGKFIERLRDAVAIPSVSADPTHRKDVVKMIDWAKEKLESLGASTELIPLGRQKLPDGKLLDLPPLLYAILGNDPSKKTVLIYGHLDVQPANKADGWNTEPFELTEKNGKLYGRGSTDDKGPIMGWINAIEAFRGSKINIPVNIKFCFEGMEESGSVGLEEALKAHQKEWLSDVDFTCISDNYWLGPSKPCITYGLRGVCYYSIEVIGSKQDLHSGTFGGTVYEPLADVIWMMSQLTDIDGSILIDGINDLVAGVTVDERKLYDTIDFDQADYQASIGAKKLLRPSKPELLMNRWRYPSLSLHGIEGAFSGTGAKTVIPAKVIGKFSIRLVPNMETTKVDELVIEYLNKIWKQRGSPNEYRAFSNHSGRYWLSDYKHPHYQCGARATKRVYGVEPDYVRDGGSIPITITFEELTGNNVMLLPMGAGDDMAHSQNEKMNVRNYIEGTKMLAAYLLELGGI